MTSPKDGCSPSGQCGCCTVLVDGKAVVSCNLGLDKIAGKEVVTLEGVDPEERRRFADAFAACGGLQCGFCIPGIVMRAKAQIDKKGADLDRAAMAPHLGAHLCRCTGYVKILDAIESVAKGKTFQPALGSGIGVSGMKYEAAELALGDRDYIDDMRVPGMLHAALHLADHARADVLAIDTAAAAAAPGVVAVFTAADVPGELRVGIIHKDWPVFIPVGGRTSYAGDVLAIVVAETRQQARDAAELVEVTYDVLAPVTDPLAAIEDGAPVAVWGTDDNVLSRSAYTRGDVDAALAASAHTVHEVFQTQRIDHAFLEPESTLAVPSGDGDERRLHVYSGGQGVWDDRDDICRVLGRRHRSGRRRAGVQRRGVRRQGGHGQPGADRARRLAARPPGEVHGVARGELPDPLQAPPDPPRVLGRVRCRRGAHGGAGARCRRLGCLRVGRDEGARAGGRPRHRSVPRAGRRRGVDRRPHQQPVVWRVPRVRRQPGAVRDGRRARPAGRGGRDQRLGDPQAQRDPAGRGVGTRPGDGRRRGRRRGLPRRDQAGVRRGARRRQGGRPRPRAEERRPGQRVAGGLRRGGPLRRSRIRGFPVTRGFGARGGRSKPSGVRKTSGGGPPRVDGDGPGRAHRRPPGRGRGARDRARTHRRHRRHDAPARVRPDHRVAGHADGGRGGAAGVRGRARRVAAVRASTTTASTSSTGRRSSAIRRIPTRRSTPPSATPPSSPSSTGNRARSSGWSPCTTSARR